MNWASLALLAETVAGLGAEGGSVVFPGASVRMARVWAGVSKGLLVDAASTTS